MTLPVKLAMSFVRKKPEDALGETSTLEGAPAATVAPTASDAIRADETETDANEATDAALLPDNGEIVVPYLANREVHEKLQSLRKYDVPARLLLALSLLSIASLFGSAMTYYLCAVIAAVIFVVVMWQSEQPSALVFDGSGIRFRWKKRRQDSPPIPWSEVTGVGVVPDESGRGNDQLHMRLSSAYYGRNKQLVYPLLYPGCFNATALSIKLLSVTPGAPRELLQHALQKHLTPEQLDTRLTESIQSIRISGPVVVPGLYIIPYTSSRKLEKHSTFLSRLETPAQVLLGLIVLGSAALFSWTATFYICVGMAIVAILLGLWRFETPALLVFDDEGLRFRWRKFWADSACIPWSAITSAGILTWAAADEDNAIVQLHLSDQHFNSTRRTLMSLLFPGFFGGEHAFSLRLKLENIDPGTPRFQLKQALAEHLTPAQIDRKLVDVLNPIAPSSYTALWLDSLSTSPKRSSEELLTPNCMVGNGRYVIESQLAAGGQGTIYKAVRKTDSQPDELVVLKEFVLPSHAGIEVSSRTLENIQREETLLKTLEHDQIVKILDFFVEDHRAYLVLEYIEGPSLKKLVESEGRLSEDKAINFGVQICEILNYLHAQQPPVVHRDLTPDNLIVTTDGALKLIDFNVAQQLESTSTRTIVGKHCYIPPEQFRGKASAQSDLYAAGATMFFLLTGTEPEPITVSHPITAQEDVSAKLDEIVAKATQPELAKRYQTSAELMRDLLELREARSDDEPT
jgi:hypothetical protein